MPVVIEKWCSHHKQMARLGRLEWNVARLVELSRQLPVMEIPLEHLGMYYSYENLSLRDMVSHMMAVRDADLSFPIILDEDGEIMDGRHRLMRALLEGHATVKAVRFIKNPSPDVVHDKVKKR